MASQAGRNGKCFRVLGVDPAAAGPTGYGVVESDGRQVRTLHYGALRISSGIRKEGPAAGQTILYFQAPWGLQLEAISYPQGMAHEKGAETVLWSPKDPTK